MINTLKNLHKTFYSTDFYRELLSSWVGVGLGFLFVVTLINIGHVSFVMATGEPFNKFMEEQTAIFESLPEITIKDGTITADTNGPRMITLLKEDKDGGVNILLDTNAASLDTSALKQKMVDERIVVYVDKKSVTIYDSNKNALEIKDAATFEDQVITHEKWMHVSSMIRSVFMPIMLIFVVVALFIGHFVTAFLGAILLLIIAPLFKTDTDLAGALRLSSAAKVPVAVIFLILAPQMVMQAVVWFGFAVFGLLANKKTQNPANTAG